MTKPKDIKFTIRYGEFYPFRKPEEKKSNANINVPKQQNTNGK
jgi:hypothetical protein